MQRLRVLLTAAITVLSSAGLLAQNPVVPPAAPSQPTPSQPVAAPPAAPPAATPAAIVPASGHPLTAPDVEAFFDGIFPLQLERSDIAGASVLVMQNGNILLQKGYGYADVKTKRAIDPASTIFRLASISKLFTWISVMQLEEQGKLNLDTDVNQYLDFQIRPAFGKPVTLRNLMTHTGGFEEVLDDILLTDPKKAVTLRDDLIANQPMRLFPPGQVPAYSNYGVGLASYIVQRVSGQPFEQYVQQHIFAPLQMTHSSFDQPLPRNLAATVSEGYRGDTTKPPVGFEIFNPVGAGGISSSAADMGRFGQMLLNGGELDGQRILKSETLQQMWTPQFQANPQLPPICMGFYQDWRNNLQWIGHEGDLIAFHSLFFVEPQQKLVLFVSYNSAGGGSKPRPEIIDYFSDRYFPGAPPVQFQTGWPAKLRDIAGQYVTTRRADSTKLRIAELGSQATAKVSKDGELTISQFKDLRGHTIHWKPVGQDLWQAVNDQQRIFAIRDSNGRVVRLAIDFPGVQFERVPVYADSRVVMPALGASLAILVLVVLTSLIRTWRRLFFRKRPKLAPAPGTLWITWGPRTASFLWVLSISVLVGFFIAQGDDFMPPTPAWFRWFEVMNWVAGVCLFFSLLAVVATLRAWLRTDLRWITKVKFSFVALACLVLSWLTVYYRLLGPTNRI